MSNTTIKEVHVADQFKPGDKVLIKRRVGEATGWTDIWSSDMDTYIGQIGTVGGIMQAKDYGFPVVVPGGVSYNYPSCSLELVVPTSAPAPADPAAQAPAAAVPAPTPVTKKRRISKLRAGPWDVAPCTHLRWNLMGFFRERLALVKSKMTVTLADGTTQEVEMAQVDVTCTKCHTKMTLQAK